MNNTHTHSSSQLLTTEELSQLLHISKNTISRWVKSGKIKAHSLQGTRRHYFLKYEIETSLNLPHLP